MRPGDEPPGTTIRVAPFGDRGFLLEPVGDDADLPVGACTAWVLGVAQLARIRYPDASAVAGLASVLLVFESPNARPSELAGILRWVLPDQPGATNRRVIDIPTRYDGPDLAEVARGLGLPAAELVARHRDAAWTVAAVGFSPGFGYLTSADPVFGAVPRRSEPRPRVPAGSVALAAGMTAVYPSPTPGGWNLIGRTDVTLFDAAQDPPALLRVGDHVRFDEWP